MYTLKHFHGLVRVCLIISFVASTLAGCSLLSTEMPTAVPTPTEILPTPTVAKVYLYQVDPVPPDYPPLSKVQEYFEAGEYDSGMETIKEWARVWEDMGVFKELGVENTSLSLVPLEGKARVVCVDTKKPGEREQNLLCPPLDLINGGLKVVPESGKWDETDKPLLVTFIGTEELVTKGSGSKLVYQFMDKYMDTQTRYFDSKTGLIVEGKSLVRDLEVVENEMIKGSVVCVSKEYCMNGQMEVDQEVAKIFYERFLDALLHVSVNEDYFNNLLNGDVSLEAFKNYLDGNNGIVPAGLTLYEWGGGAYISLSYVLDKPLNLSSLKTISFGPKEWQNNVSGIQEYIKEFNDGGLVNATSEGPVSFLYYGWIVDNDGYLVLVGGAKDPSNRVYTIGGNDGEYLPERDNKVATGILLSIITCMERYDGSDAGSPRIFLLPLDIESHAAAQNDNVQDLAGGRYLFKPTY